VARIMLARMNTLEEGFREMLKEVRVLRKEGSGGGSGVGTGSGSGVGSRSGTEYGAGEREREKGTRSQRGSGLTISTVPLAAPSSAASGAGGAAAQGLGIASGPQTPGGSALRPGSAGSRARKSPRKLQRRGTKGKENASVNVSAPNSATTSPETPGRELEATPEEEMGTVRRYPVPGDEENKRASVIFVGEDVDEEREDGEDEQGHDGVRRGSV